MPIRSWRVSAAALSVTSTRTFDSIDRYQADASLVGDLAQGVREVGVARWATPRVSSSIR